MGGDVVFESWEWTSSIYGWFSDTPDAMLNTLKTLNAGLTSLPRSSGARLMKPNEQCLGSSTSGNVVWCSESTATALG